ncbi:molybdenum cofactor guanylyltransferase [soil metagenome]
MISFSDIDGWIVAGGVSRRMGRDKAALEIDGRSLIELAGKALSSISEGRISIAGEPRAFASQWLAFPDKEAPGLGPLSGLETALSNGNSEWIAVISCDLPFVTGDVFLKLADQIGPKADAIVPKADAIVPIQPDARPQPLCALYRRKPALDAAVELLKSTDRSLHNLLSRITTHYVPFSSFQDLSNAEHLFLNINSPADYVQAKDIACQNRNRRL